MRDLLMQMSELQMEERQERREYEKRIMSILEKLADQGARLTNTEAREDENHTDINNIAEKIRTLELANQTEDVRVQTMYTFYQMTTNKYAVYCLVAVGGIILMNTITNCIYHGDGILYGIRWISKIFNGG
jgi:septal ring factor EnvC (AmiA/AmiB activator)